MDSVNLSSNLREEQIELLLALDRLFLKRSEWASQRRRPIGVADLSDEFTHDQRGTHTPTLLGL
jgi:hypothetical protein